MAFGVAMRGLAAVAIAAATAGCVNDPEERAPQCPRALLLPEAARLARYDGRGTDLTDVVLTATITDVKGSCSGVLGGRVLHAKAHAEMQLTLGPAARGRAVGVPYNIAVLRHDQVLDKKQYVAHAVFPPNVDSIALRTDDVPFEFPTPHGLGGATYSIYYVFQLSPGELAVNARAAR